MNPFHNLALVIAYLTTIFVLAQIMKRASKPAPTKYLALWHNLFCTLLSLYMCVEIWRQAYIGRYHVISESIDRTPAGLPVRHTHRHAQTNFERHHARPLPAGRSMGSLAAVGLVSCPRWRLSCGCSTPRRCRSSSTRS